MWLEVDDDRCSGCGQPKTESFHPDHEDSYEVKAWVCHSCKARADRQAKQADPDSLRYTFFTTHLDKEEHIG